MTCPMMEYLGVYLLGAADKAEQQRLAAHLPGCRECRAELRRLAPLPGLLAGIPESVWEASPSPGRQSRPLRAAKHVRTRWRWTVPAAACLAAGVAGGVWLSSGSRAPAAVTLTGTNPHTHVSATATLTATSWGSRIQLRVRGLPEYEQCRLAVRSRDGHIEVSGAWDTWREGAVSVPASASWLPSDIASLQVTTPTTSLVTMSASQQKAGAGR
ncbi:MAG: zf-HC2 domain-containing protein [Actinobacteria bacterium]|nr:zf-HC2 domain-containing protein [Actinomycetota bacterium]